jgi:hypothetical protein
MKRWRLPVALCLLNWFMFAYFMAVRPAGISDESQLDIARTTGGAIVFRSSSEPINYIAERPLYSWNAWHGGELLFVKILEILNMPALVLAHVAARLSSVVFGASLISVSFESWLRAWIFLVLASVQWWVTGRFITSRLSRSRANP